MTRYEVGVTVTSTGSKYLESIPGSEYGTIIRQ
jgi:hypothetical protein